MTLPSSFAQLHHLGGSNRLEDQPAHPKQLPESNWQTYRGRYAAMRLVGPSPIRIPKRHISGISRLICQQGTFCEAVIALILPPLAVLLRTGCSLDLFINIGLCFFGWLPAIIHAELLILLSCPGRREVKALERERYVYNRYHGRHYDHHHYRR